MNLLVVSRYSDEHFESADYIFVHHQVRELARYFDEVTVVAPIPYFPEWLRPVGRVWEKLRLRMLARDYARGRWRYDTARSVGMEFRVRNHSSTSVSVTAVRRTWPSLRPAPSWSTGIAPRVKYETYT